MSLTTDEVAVLKRKVSGSRVDIAVKKMMLEFVDALAGMDVCKTVGATGSVVDGAGSEVIRFKDGLITTAA